MLFAVGAVSGTVLTFEMGLLWPGLMRRFGDAYGIPFAVEGLFFFLEAIFIAIYVYGWKRLPAWPHWWTGVPVVLSGIGGTLAVVAANAWMNHPQGFTLRHGKVTDVKPFEVFFNDAFWHESVHMLLAAYLVAGFLVAAVYAAGMLRGRRDRYHRLGFLIPFTIAAVVMPFQWIVGDWAARQVFQQQPVKFAAQELVIDTRRHAPETHRRRDHRRQSGSSGCRSRASRRGSPTSARTPRSRGSTRCPRATGRTVSRRTSFTCRSS